MSTKMNTKEMEPAPKGRKYPRQMLHCVALCCAVLRCVAAQGGSAWSTHWDLGGNFLDPCRHPEGGQSIDQIASSLLGRLLAGEDHVGAH
jgi:hypothetical protein